MEKVHYTEKQIERAKLLEKIINQISHNKKIHGERNIQSIFKKYNFTYEPKTYYVLRKKYEKNGLAGLLPQRHKCGRKAQKSTSEVSAFIKELKQNNIHLAGKKIQRRIKEKFETEISVSQINRVIKKNTNLISIKGRPAQEKEISLNYAGYFILIAATIETEFINQLISAQKNVISHILKRDDKRGSSGGIKEEKGIFSKDKDGKFKKYSLESEEEYKENGEISNKFRSVENRIKDRDLQRLAISQACEGTLYRKNMTLLSLPVITSHSRFGELNDTLGDELKYLSGFDYKGNTIDKYMREMKYLQLSNILLNKTAEFWHNCWKKYTSEDINQVCYYFDGHKKPLWSSYRIKQSHVAMLGRVMGCLEQVYIHTDSGHPIMLQTFSGGVYLPEAIKQLHKQMNKIIPQDINRISIFDGGGNSVDFYETFKDNEYFICILDNNQYKQDLSDFTIIKQNEYEGKIYIEAEKMLRNSRNKTLYKIRTPIYKKLGSNKYISFVTNIAQDNLSAKEVVDMYYKRWPNQELQFRDMNNGGDLSTNYGFGKTRVINVVVQNKKKYLNDQIAIKKIKIKEISNNINELKNQKNILLKKQIKEFITNIDLVEKKILKAINKKNLNVLLKQLNQLYAQKEKSHAQLIKNELKSKLLTEKLLAQLKREKTLLKKNESEFNRISKKEIVYKNDIELDQLVGMFKIGFANLSAYVLREYFSGEKMSLEKLINKVFKRPGKLLIHGSKKEISIYLNKKDNNISELIKKACQIINSRAIQLSDNKQLRLNPLYIN